MARADTPGGAVGAEPQESLPATYWACADAATAAISREWAGALTPMAVARAVGKSRRHLDRVFRAIYGRTVQQYITEVRLGRAARRLHEGWKVDAVIADTGFKSRRQFYRAFQRRFGMTPGVFRAGKADRELR